jgi:hypothetical protein|tara:strand:+ start:355 stop:546 length:192 start_codon:yes stop_codon:yes gene_type:complete
MISKFIKKLRGKYICSKKGHKVKKSSISMFDGGITYEKKCPMCGTIFGFYEYNDMTKEEKRIY